MKKAIVFLTCLIFSTSFGQSLKKENIDQWADEYFVEGMFALKEFLQLPNIGSNPDNSIHAPNENLRLGNFHEGLKMCLGILTQNYD